MNEEDLSQLWMVPYADLMSTLVLLFMSLFAYSYGQRSPEVSRTLAQIEQQMSPDHKSAERLKETELAVTIKQELNGLALKDFGVRVTARSVRLTLPSPILFDEGSVRLTANAGRVLGPLAKLFAQCQNPILVEGYTDDVPVVGGRFRSNWELSAGRSFSVIEYLIDQGLPPDRFHARGYGEYRPVAPNDTPEGRQRNRRIEISLIREYREEQ